jgi:protein ImuB
LLALDKNDVTERLGPAVAELLKRVSPGSPRPLKLVTPPETFSEQIEFETEIETAEPLLFVLRRFVEQLSRRLELIYLVISEFQLQLGLSSGAKYERTFKIPAPTANIKILFRMLQTHLETVRTDSSITSLRLAAKPARAEAQQFGLFESSLRDPNQFAETLAQLTALVGSDNIGTPEPVASHKPDSFRMIVPEFNGQMERARLGRRESRPRGSHQDVKLSLDSVTFNAANVRRETHRTAAGITAVAGQAAALHSKIGLSLRRFRPPMPSQVEFRDEKPSLLRCRIFIGPVVETRGPFLSSGNWWDTDRWERQEWDIKTSDGSLLRIFRSADGCFVEGTYD